MAHARLPAARFEAVVRAVQATCGFLAEGREALVATPGEEGFSSEVQHEYLALLAVVITGSLDHRVVELPGPGGVIGLAVVETIADRGPASSADGSGGACSGEQWHASSAAPEQAQPLQLRSSGRVKTAQGLDAARE
ncbi:hypothetical protein [Streptomyces sp. A1136]|uniref:hypothetical protein n=1 Tax=Streptomyces sp. A1136 TaxID=2563102 RepID=UPI00109E5D4B|nr:hypothetical protein [Streptomyces sp. A1136]THA46193.1 hypothetical protein E6R62_34435 [Streptomyces sp. A1136]